MDTNLMEINGIMESFKLDMLTIEQENFMNIMYTRHNGVLNESIIHEGFKETFKKVIGKIKEAIKKLIGKLKEVLAKIVDENKKEIKGYGGDFKNIADDYEFDPVFDYNESVELLNDLKKANNNMKIIIDKVINKNIEKTLTPYKERVNEDEMRKAIDMLSDKYKEYNNNKDNILPNTRIYYGKDAKNLFAKYSKLESEFRKMEYDATTDLINYLKKADDKMDKVGNTFVNSVYGGNVDNFTNDYDVESFAFKGDDKQLSYLMNQYIEFFSICCKNVLVYKAISEKMVFSLLHFKNTIIQLAK